MLRSFLCALVCIAACGDAPEASRTQPTASQPSKVGYDLRRLRPRNDEKLAAMFERLRADAAAEGKQVAVLFSADWCHQCQGLELELGNMHPPEHIAHVRILELKEEDWEAVTRMDEFNALRARWHGVLNTYPVVVLLDEKGHAIEEMQDAISRLEHEGIEPTLANWFAATKLG